MACDKLGPRLTEYLFEEIDDAERKRVEEHVASCDDCRAELALLESTTSLVREAHHLEEAEQTLSADRRDAIRQAAAVISVQAAPEAGLWRRWRIPTFSLAFGCTILFCFAFTFEFGFRGMKSSRRASTQGLLSQVEFSRKREQSPPSVKHKALAPRPGKSKADQVTAKGGGEAQSPQGNKEGLLSDFVAKRPARTIARSSGKAMRPEPSRRSPSAPISSGPSPKTKPAPKKPWSFTIAPGGGAAPAEASASTPYGDRMSGKKGSITRTRGLGSLGGSKEGASTKDPADEPVLSGEVAKDWSFEKRYERLDTLPFLETSEEPKSTFAVDVDTASYTQMRSYIYSNVLPPAASVRVEEFVNFFDYEYAPPERGDFAIHGEASPSPYRDGYHLLRIGLKAREVDSKRRRPARLTFVIDVSGSMAAPRRLPLVRRALSMLVGELGEGDFVGIVTYGSSARIHLAHTPATRRQTILNAIGRLKTNGSTNAEAGLTLGYTEASRIYAEGCSNRVILCSDGLANTGRTRADAILAKVKSRADKGIFLTTVGFGKGSYNDRFMERLANRGNGVNAYVDGLDEARRIFVKSLTGTLQVVARDAKIQVDWNPARVHKYRLLGYENRVLRNKDFRDDTVDAGEVGAGHTVTAVYEIKLKATSSTRLATLRVRYKMPRSDRIVTIQQGIETTCMRNSFAEASPRHRLAVVVCQYAEILRKSYWAKGRTIEDVLPDARALAVTLSGDKQVEEFGRLVKKAYELQVRR